MSSELPSHLQRDVQTLSDYVHLVEDTGAIICVANFENKYVRVSNAFARLLGRERADMEGQPTTPFIHPDDAGVAAAEMAQLGAGTLDRQMTADYVLRFIAKDGTIVHIAWNAMIDLEQGRVYCFGRNVTAERKLQAELEARSRLEGLLTKVSTSFAALAPERTDEGINEALGEVARFFDVDRTYVFGFRDDGHTVDNTHEYCAPGAAARRDDMQAIPFDRFGWFFQQVRQHGICRIETLDDFPPEAAEGRAQSERDHIKSCVAVAMSFQGEVVGFLGLESVRMERAFTDDTVRMLRVLGDVLVASLDRKRSYDALRDKLATIERQQLAIRDLSTPVIEIWEDILTLPIVGVIDSQRSSEMTSRLLAAIDESGARCVIVDVTGVDVVDTMTADHLIRMIRAARLLGAYCVLTGLSPDVAQTLVRIGVDLRGIRTLRSLKEGLKSCFLRLRQIDEGREIAD
jgi:rsbT co-antagonist protein RsbR